MLRLVLVEFKTIRTEPGFAAFEMLRLVLVEFKTIRTEFTYSANRAVFENGTIKICRSYSLIIVPQTKGHFIVHWV
jgi:hypothetical protein